MKSNILIIDDDAEVRSLMSDVLSDEGYATATASNETEAFSCLKNSDYDLIFLDLWIGDDESAGLKIIEKIKKQNSEIPVVIISGHGTIDIAVSAIKNGAFDFIEKPFVIDRLLLTANHAIEFYKLSQENAKLKTNKMDTDVIGVGKSQFVQSLKSNLDKIAPINSRVFIEMFPGTCAENIAYYIHKKSDRAECPFIYFNCSSNEQDKLGKELFGTGNFRGYLERANYGTIFLDNVTELSKNNQRILLQFIQENKLVLEQRGNVYLNVRVISAHNQRISLDNFSQELFYRLNIINIKIPELKNRREDICPLIHYYLSNSESFFGLKSKNFSEESLAILQSYDWPGNIYQVKSIIENSLINAMENEYIEKKDLPTELTASTREKFTSLNTSKFISLPMKKAKEAFETDYLKAQVARFSGNISKTAEFIGMERTALHRKLKSLGLMTKKDK